MKMESLLDRIEPLDNLLRQLQKMESKMRSGQFIDAWKDCTRLISIMERAKVDLIEHEQEQEEKENDV